MNYSFEKALVEILSVRPVINVIKGFVYLFIILVLLEFFYDLFYLFFIFIY